MKDFEPPFKVEYRMIVKGWKVENGVRKEFASASNLYLESSVYYERARIGEPNLPDWQPHITEVVVQHRFITEWIDDEI